MIDDENYFYELLTSQEDAHTCAQLSADVFTKTNPITMAHGVTFEQHFKEISLPLINKVLDEHLSFIARNRTTQEIIGCIIIGDFYLQRLDHKPYTGFYSLGNLFEELDDMFVNGLYEELKPNTILQIKLTVTKETEISKGLATRLSQIACEYARRTRHFQYAHVQVTHPATQHIYLNKFHGKIVSEIDPTTWIWKQGGNTMPYKDWTIRSLSNILFSLDNLET